MNLKNYAVGGFLSLGLSLGMWSCSSDDGGKVVEKDMTPQEAKAFVETSLTSFNECVKEYEKGKFADFLYYYYVHDDDIKSDTPPYRIENPNGKSDWIDDVFSVWEKQYGAFFKHGEEFNFEKNKGVYTWNKDTDKFTKEKTGNEIIIKFPSDRSESDLNLQFEIKKYTAQKVSFSNKIDYVPTSLHILFTDKGEKITEFVAKDVKFDVYPQVSLPLSGDVVWYTAPFTHTMKLGRETPTTFYLTDVLTNEGGCKSTIKAQMVFAHADYASFTDVDKVLNAINIELGHGEFAVKANLNNKEFSRISKDFGEMTDAEFKNVVKMEVFKNDAKVGDIVLDNFKDSDRTINLILSDGSKQDITQSFKGAMDQLKEIVKRFVDEEEND